MGSMGCYKCCLVELKFSHVSESLCDASGGPIELVVSVLV